MPTLTPSSFSFFTAIYIFLCSTRSLCYNFQINCLTTSIIDMCGISALFSSSQPFKASAIQAMNNAIRHRGPDDEGYFLYQADYPQGSICAGHDTPQEVLQSPMRYCPNKHLSQHQNVDCLAALGHRRLAILDLSPSGHQPMNLDQLWITFNGEIYNYVEIRAELISLGCCFNTQSDTEVILHAYRTWGVDCLHRFNGMFAFVIFDAAQQKIFAARDRFGVKPLYFWQSLQGLLAIASEIKQFTTLPGWNPKVNPQRAYDFLNWGLLDHTCETLFEGVFQLRGGEYFLSSLQDIGHAHLQIKRWYTLQPKAYQGTFENAAQAFKELLLDAVRLRLRADVPVGSCLSGGLDSSSIVCLVHNILGEGSSQRTFSACSHHKRFDEREHIEQVIRKTGVDAHYTYPDVDQLIEESAAILWHQDEPYPTTSIYAQWQVFKLVKEQNVKVMLDGQGADEQLAGYQGFFGNHIYELFMGMDWKGVKKEIQAIKEKHPHLKPWPMLFNKLVPDPIRQPIRRFMGKSAAGPKWLDMPLLGALDKHPLKGGQNSTVLAQSIEQLMHTSLPMLLHFEDRDSMAHSVESRTPFLDYRLVEFNLGLPTHYKIGSGWTKRIMRESLKDILPPSICWRVDKMGFVTAEEEWICKERPTEFMHIVERSIELAQGIIKNNAQTMASQMIKGQQPYNPVLWRQITFAQWLDVFNCSF